MLLDRFGQPPNVSGVFIPPTEPLALSRPYVLSPAARLGFPSPAMDFVEQPLDLNQFLVRNAPATFFVRMQGDSMIDMAIIDNDVGVVDRSMPARKGALIVASVDGEIVSKVYEAIGTRMALSSRNTAANYSPIYLDECNEIVLWGCVTGLARRI